MQTQSDMLNPVVSLYRVDRKNVGDWYCAPARYFPALAGRSADIFAIRGPTRIDADVIVGGGGLFSPTFNPRFELIQPAQGQRWIGWGVGENMRINKAAGWVGEQPFKLPDWARRFDLLGVRDWGTPARWVPCASCLHPGFTTPKPAPVHEVVVYEHKRVPIDIADLPKRSNNGCDIDATLAFLASGHVVVTNSYHGAFWAALLGRAVVAFPFSTKFYGLRHRPVLCRPADWKKSVEKAITHPQALAECREATMDFFGDALKLLGRKPDSRSSAFALPLSSTTQASA
jgi:hypothetical protein